MNVKAISVNVGKALLVSALFMFFSIVVSILNGRDSAFGPLMISFIITLIVGAFPFVFVKKTESLSMQDGFVTIFLSWLLSFIFGMLPYVLWGGEFTLMNAWFESVSGYTTTGSTILTNVEALPKSLLLWRSSTHFIGGLGVVVFLLLVMPDMNPYRLKLTNMEISSLSREGYRYKSKTTVKIIAFVYMSIALLSFLCFWAAGMSAFDAVNHAFSVVATGGFSTKNLSIGSFDSMLINAIAMFFMVVAATHFGLIFSAIATRSLKPLRKSSVFKWFLLTIAVLSVVTAISLLTQGGYTSWWRALFDAGFNVISYISTTGFAVCDNVSWPWLAGALLMFAAIHGGCSGSTAGALKEDRIIISARVLWAEIKTRLHPSSMNNVRVDKHILQDKEVKSILLYLVVYFALLYLSILLVLTTGTSMSVAVSGVISSVGNVGPGLSEISLLGNYSAQPDFAKFIYTIDMFLGRVEIYPVLTALSLLIRREK